MAIDTNPAPRAPDDGVGPRINDDLPAYRALSGLAVFGLIMGLASILTFTSVWFALLGAISVAAGLLSIRTINRYPDAMTGAKIARAGIALSLVFTLTALTNTAVQTLILRLEASRFANLVTRTFQDGTLNDILYLKATVNARAGKTPAEVVAQFQESTRAATAYDMETRAVREIKDRLADPGTTITYLGLERQAPDRMSAIAIALFEIKGPPTKEHPNARQLAAMQFRGVMEDGKYAWNIEEIEYPRQSR